TQLAAESRLLEAAKGHCCVHQTIRVDPNQPSTQLSRDAVSLVDITRPNRGSQSVRIGVCLLDHLIQVIETQSGQHWTKNFFLRDLHIVGNVTKNGGLDE